jgi:hypothetical protein
MCRLRCLDGDSAFLKVDGTVVAELEESDSIGRYLAA